jgi:hypothetical protein
MINFFVLPALRPGQFMKAGAFQKAGAIHACFLFNQLPRALARR